MNVFTVSLFGHREIDDLRQLENRLVPIIKEVIQTDNIIIPESVYFVHPKSAITLKNRWVIEQSDLVIVYVEREKGGDLA